MNKQEAIERLKALSRMFEEAPTGAISEAIFSLGKEIPRKLEYDCRKHLYICPHCGEYIDTYNHDYPYDMKCGGRLEW